MTIPSRLIVWFFSRNPVVVIGVSIVVIVVLSTVLGAIQPERRRRL